MDKDPYLKQGYAGMALFLFWWYRKMGNPEYRELSQYALHKACSLLKAHGKVNFDAGMCGVGMTVIYMIKMGLMSGNLAKILHDVNDDIYKSVIKSIDYKDNFSILNHEESLIDVAYYTARMVSCSNLSEVEKAIQELFLQKIINTIYQKHEYSFYFEPIPFSSQYILAKYLFALSYAYRLKSCQDRINKIWEESRSNVLAQFPFLDCNKVLLFNAVHRLLYIFPKDNDLKLFAERLLKCISIKNIVANEMPTNNLSLMTGLCGVALCHLSSNSLCKSDKIMILKRMQSSSFFNANYKTVEKEGFVGLNGILGFLMTYNFLCHDCK